MNDLPRAFGDYLLLKKIGQGGWGQVLLARPLRRTASLPAALVIKCLRAEMVRDRKFVRRFAHEARLAIAIDSPYVVKVYDVGAVGDTLFIAMELIDGMPLSSVLTDLKRTHRHLKISNALHVIRGALLGLAALHEARDENGRSLGIVHRDVAPKNIMVDERQQPRLIDLGIGKSRLREWKTRTGMILGSPGYMAPEQVLAENVDHRADLYAIAIVAFELLTVTRYIDKGSQVEMLRASVKPPFKSVLDVRDDAPPALDAVLKKALAHERQHRFQTAREMIAALDEAVGSSAEEEPLETVISETLIAEQKETRTSISQALEIATTEPHERPSLKTIVYAQRGRAPARAQPRWMIFAWTGALVAIAPLMLLLGMWLERSKQAPAGAISIPFQAPVRAVAGSAPPEELAPASIEVSPEPLPVRMKTRVREAGRPEPRDEDTKPPPLSTPELVDVLIRRAMALRGSSAQTDELQTVLADLNDLRASPRLEQERDKVEALQARIDRLSRAH